MNARTSVIGTGYLGTTHAACLAELGFVQHDLGAVFEAPTAWPPTPPATA